MIKTKINILVIGEGGGGNVALKNLLKTQNSTSQYEFKLIRIGNRGSEAKSSLGFLVLNGCKFLVLGCYFTWTKREYVLYSDPVFSFLGCFFTPSRRILWVQSHDLNLFIREDGYGALYIAVFRALVRFSSRLKYRAVLANSNYTKFHFDHLSGGRNDVAVVHPLISRPRIEQPTARSTGRIILSTITRNKRRKGFSEFCELVSILKSRGLDMSIVLISSDDLPVENDWRFVRPCSYSEIFTALQSSDIYVSTTTFEGLGLPVLEAMSVGLPVVALDNGGVRDLDWSNAVQIRDTVKELALEIERLAVDAAFRFEQSDCASADYLTYRKIALGETDTFFSSLNY